MTITARMLTQDNDGIGGYMAHPDGPGTRPGGRLLIPFAADHPTVKAIVLYYPSVRDEPETSHRPRHAFKLAPTLKCATLVFAGGKDYIATPAIQAPLWQAFLANGQPVEWHY